MDTGTGGASVLPFGTPLIIANPSAGRGRDDVLRRLHAALEERSIHADVVATAAPGHAGELARRAVEDGRRFLVAVGGDGTVNEVVNGLVDATTGRSHGNDPVLGVVGAGSGCDLLRTFGLDRSPEVLARHLSTAHTMPIDLGRVWFQDADGQRRARLFVNVAEAGYGGSVMRLAARLPRALGAVRYPAAILGAVAGFRRVTTSVTVDGGTTEEAICNVLVANAQFYGGGLHVAPRALPSDGRLNVQTWGGRPIDVLRAQPELRTGRHLARPDVREWQSTTVEVTSERPLIVEADGEVLGVTPATFDVLPGALRLKV
jgi:diacylglycerol kinase (ATP)